MEANTIDARSTDERRKFTPGPWKASQPSASEGEPAGTYSIRYNGPDHAWHIASVYGESINGRITTRHGTAKANATLIAAAPDLEAACVQMVDAWSMIAGGDQPYQVRDAIKAIRAALTLAHG